MVTHRAELHPSGVDIWSIHRNPRGPYLLLYVQLAALAHCGVLVQRDHSLAYSDPFAGSYSLAFIQLPSRTIEQHIGAGNVGH